MNRVAVKQKLSLAASGPVLARLIPAEEFDSIADLRVEYGRRINELKAAHEEIEKLTSEKRRAQDVAVQNFQTANELARQVKSTRMSLLLNERKLHDAKAELEGLDSAIRTVLATWIGHDDDCDDGCIAAVEVPRSLVDRFGECGIGDDSTMIPAAVVLQVAMDERESEVIRLAAEWLAQAIRNGVPLRWRHCGELVTECDPCLEHETCNPKGKPCPECLHEDEGGRRQDMRHEARIAKGRL